MRRLPADLPGLTESPRCAQQRRDSGVRSGLPAPRGGGEPGPTKSTLSNQAFYSATHRRKSESDTNIAIFCNSLSVLRSTLAEPRGERTFSRTFASGPGSLGTATVRLGSVDSLGRNDVRSAAGKTVPTIESSCSGVSGNLLGSCRPRRRVRFPLNLIGNWLRNRVWSTESLIFFRAKMASRRLERRRRGWPYLDILTQAT